MLDRVFDKFPNVEGLIFHSNQGWQYQHAYFRNVLQEHCIMETFFERLENEMYSYMRPYKPVPCVLVVTNDHISISPQSHFLMVEALQKLK